MEGDSPSSPSATSEGEDDMNGGSRQSSSDDDINVDVNDDALDQHLDGSQMNGSSICSNKDEIVEDVEEFFLRQPELVRMEENGDLGGEFVHPSKSCDNQATKLSCSELVREAFNSISERKQEVRSTTIDEVETMKIEDSKQVQLAFVSGAFSSKSESKQEGSSSTIDEVQ